MVHRGNPRPGVAVLLAALGLILSAALVAGPAMARTRHRQHEHKPVGACNAHRKHATLVTHRVIIYGKRRGQAEFDVPLTAYYACLRPAGKSALVGLDAPPDGEYPSNNTTNTIRVAGTYVAALSTSGTGDAAACHKYDPDNSCPTPTAWIQLVDANSRRQARIPTGGFGAGPIALSASGAVAWVGYTSTASPPFYDATLYAMVLHAGLPGQLAGTTQTLDTSSGVELKSLHWSGLTLSWTNTGRPRRATLA